MTTDRNHKAFAPRRCALTAAPFLISLVALYNWVISPQVGYLRAVQRLEPVVTRMAEELDAVEGGRDEKISTLRGLQAELVKVREGLFTGRESKAFIQDLPAILGKTGCAVAAVDFSVDAQGTDDPNAVVVVETLHADCTLVGGYEQIVALLQLLRQNRQKVWVDSCRMDHADPRGERLECQLGLTLYIALQPGGFRP